MTLIQFWRLLRKNWLILLVFTILGVAVGGGVSALQPRLYSATSTGYVVAGESSTLGDAFASTELAAKKASTYLPLVKSRSVAEKIAEDLSLDSIGPVRGALEATADGVIFNIKATATSPELAAEIADAAIRATSIEANALETMTISGEESGKTIVSIVPMEQAVTPTRPVSPDWKRNFLLGAALGLMAGLGIVVARQSLDRRIRSSDEAEMAADSSLLGIVPRSKELAGSVNLSKSMGPAAEAIRQLRTNLRFVSVDEPAKCIVITSSNEGEGKSTIAAHLASMLAASGQPTILVDADLRRPVQSGLFGVDGDVGLTHVLARTVQLEEALVQTDNRNLRLLPAGRIPPNPSELVGSGRMQALLKGMSKGHMVIVDAPPLLPVTDASLLSTAADGAILVVKQGKTRVEQVALASRRLEQVKGTLLGVVLNNVPPRDMGDATYGYGYGTYSSSYYRAEDAGPERRAATPRRVKPEFEDLDQDAPAS